MEFGTTSPSSSEKGLEAMELDAARALADFKQMAKIEGRPQDSNESRSEHADLVDNDPQDNKDTEAPVEERIKVDQDYELSISSFSCASSHVSYFGRRMKQNMTEAEREAKRIRRVLANRESARQTIQRRQALRDELIKRVAELSRENKCMKMMVKEMNSEVKVGAETVMRHVVTPSSPSTELSLVATWPSISPASVTRYGETGSSKSCARGTQFFVPTCVWFYPLLHQTSEFHPSTSHASGDKGVDSNVNTHESGHCLELGDNLDRLSLRIGCKMNVLSAKTTAIEEEKDTGINLEEMPFGFDRYSEISEHDPGGDEVMNPCPAVEDEQEIDIRSDKTIDLVGSIVAEKSHVASNLRVMKLVDPIAAAAARKRRKELTRLKYLPGKQLRLRDQSLKMTF